MSNVLSIGTVNWLKAKNSSSETEHCETRSHFDFDSKLAMVCIQNLSAATNLIGLIMGLEIVEV